MSGDIWILAALGLVAALSIAVASERRRLALSLVTYRLTFPRQLEATAVERTMAGLSGLLLPWWRRWIAAPYVVLETRSSPGGIEHLLSVPREWSTAALNALDTAIPAHSAVLQESLESRPQVAAEYRLNSNQRPLRVDDPGTLSTGLLNALQPLRADEEIVVQWVLTPSPPVAAAHVAGDRRPGWFESDGAVATSEEAAALRQKQASPELFAVARIGVRAGSRERQRRLLREVESVWHGSRAPGVHMERRLLPAGLVAGRIAVRAVPQLLWPGRFNAAELSGLIGWPIDVVAIQGLILGPSRLLAPSPRVPASGSVLGDSLASGPRPLALDLEARLRHLHVLGPTGTGKSTLLVNLVAQDLLAGHGVVLIDPKGDLVESVLERVPPARASDVVVLDPTDEQRPVGLNPLGAAVGISDEVVVENLLGLFKSLYRSSWGPRTDDIFRAALMTLAQAPGSTLCELPLLLADAGFRRRFVGRLDDPVGLESFWGWYEHLSDAERASVVGPVLNKVRAFTMRPRVRAIVGQARPKLSLKEVIDGGKVLVVSLAAGVLGEEAAGLLGALIVAELWHAVSARAAVAPAERRPVMAYLDEWQHFLHLPTAMATVLAEARGFRLGMTLAHQHIEQLPADARHAVLANARSRVAFQLPAGDARIISRELGGLLSPEDLSALGPYEAVAQIYAAGSTQTPASLRTKPAQQPTSSSSGLRETSRQRYGMPREAIEAELRQRHSPRTPSAPIGRRDVVSQRR